MGTSGLVQVESSSLARSARFGFALNARLDRSFGFAKGFIRWCRLGSGQQVLQK
jgi:non-ribosomal peptide synthetase component E (peptide arylation enzyme)